MTDIQIKNSSLDSNTLVNMQGVTFTPGYKKINSANPLNGSQQPKIPEGDRTGIEVPIINIVGVINVNDFASTAELWSETPSTLSSTDAEGNSNTNKITLGYLNALYRETVGQTVLNIKLGDPGSQKDWKNWDNSSTDIYVIVDDITPIPDVSTEGRHIINYTIACREVVADGTYT